MTMHVTDIQDITKQHYLEKIIKRIIDGNISNYRQYHEINDDGYDRAYQVYSFDVNNKSYILKKSNEDELQVYERYIHHMEHLNVPKYYGHTIYYKKHWIVTEYINGTDLRQFTTSMAKQAAETIVDIANTFWNHEDTEGRCQRYFERIKKRSLCLPKESRLAKAYDLFLERQKTIPLTLSTGDYLQFNALEASDGRVYAIDWGFGGIMPYALDVARMIVHGSEEYKPFPFYMNNELRKEFVDTYYSKLKYPPNWDTYIHDICLAALNECIEFMEDDFLHNKKTDIDYTVMANALADELPQPLHTMVWSF